MGLSLQSLLTPSKTIEVEYPNKEGFKVTVSFLSREELVKLRKACVTTKFNKRTRQPEDELNEDLFMRNYVNAVVKGWSGLKYKYLEDMILIDLSAVTNVEDELTYSQEDALVLMKNSSDFDSFITEIVGDLGNFTAYSSSYSNKD